ncbi:MAG: hypothetical protein MK132_06780 [Lentisphaerales bacterium]|nr:hypothetical protein [Lentisphaerales bacterium]
MNIFKYLIVIMGLVSCAHSETAKAVKNVPAQVVIPLINRMPDFPQPYHMRNWQKVSLDYDKVLYDLNAKGEHMPLMKLIPAEKNINTGKTGFGFTSYVGPSEQNKDSMEAIAVIGSVLGATYAGLDKTTGEHNWVEMCEQYYNKANGRNLVLNQIDTSYDSFWYTVFPHILFYSVSDRYPNVGKMREIMKITADKWYKAAYIMGGSQDKTGFDFTYFDFDSMRPMKNGKWIEPDSAAGIGWLMYSAYLKLKDQKYLDAAKWCMESLNNRLLSENPYYEVQLPFGAYAAVRMNAELGTNYDVHKFINWCFEHSSKVRGDMGVIHETWKGNDCNGLVGSINTPPWRTRPGGYAFAMNTFAMAAPLVSMLRYDDRYASSIGKWILNAANAARLFYGNFHWKENQSSPEWQEGRKGLIAYEGLRQFWDKDESLFASGDAVNHNWGYATDYGLYGSSYVGVFGGMIRQTNQRFILQLDVLATNFDSRNSYPTYLYFNPYDVEKKVLLDLPAGNFDIYDTVGNRFLAKNVSTQTELTIPANASILIVIAPANGVLKQVDHKTYINDVIVDYR